MMDRLAVGLSLVLLFVWSLPGTIALRNILLVAALVLLARRLLSAEFRKINLATWPSLLLLGTLTLWFLAQALLVSPETEWALDELHGQWLPALLSLLLGLALGFLTQTRTPVIVSPATLLTGIALVFGALATLAVLDSAWHWLQHGELLRQLVPLTGGKLEMSFVLNLLLALLAVDLYCRATGRLAVLRLPVTGIGALLCVALLCGYLAGARNGLIGMLFLSAATVSLYLFDQRQRLGASRIALTATAIIVLLVAFGTAYLKADPRWETFSETAQLAWNIDKESGWHDLAREWPLLPNGEPAEASAYIRVAYIRTGLRQIDMAPLGYGYGRNAFGHALQARGQPVSGHAHSGWIDLGVGGGIPALLLWAMFLGSLILHGRRVFVHNHNPIGLLLLLIAAEYALRMVLDSVNKDHMLQIFMFLVGLLLILTASPQKPAQQ
jgi:hypothetical protein